MDYSSQTSETGAANKATRTVSFVSENDSDDESAAPECKSSIHFFLKVSLRKFIIILNLLSA